MLKVEIIGNIGNDAEIKEFGERNTFLSVLHTEYQKDEQGNRTDLTAWCSVLLFGEGACFLTLKEGQRFLFGETSKLRCTQTEMVINKPQSM